jgi:predicted signal transduction protein with EAL and GGDEF domain
VLLENIVTVQQVASRAQSILDAISAESTVAGQGVFISASIGISMFPEDGGMADALLVNADTAMYRAKERGKNNFQFYTADMNARAIERLKMEYSLHRALAQDELEVWYQPKVELASGRIIGGRGAAALAPGHGADFPVQFIPIAEESSLITSIGEWVLDSSCASIRRWRDAGLLQGRIAVNVSGRQLKYSSIVDTVASMLERYACPAVRWSWKSPKAWPWMKTAAWWKYCTGCRRWASTCPLTILAPAIPACPTSSACRYVA